MRAACRAGIERILLRQAGDAMLVARALCLRIAGD
jgi:hypothetical protein